MKRYHAIRHPIVAVKETRESGAIEIYQRPNYTFSDAVALASWLNEREAGYPEPYTEGAIRG